MVDVFISYSRENQALVRRLAEAVKREGYSVWWDDELPPHRSYGDVITEKIGAARAAIVVWSHGAAASEWVRAEADVARNQKKLIQVSIDERMPPLPFNQLHFVSIGDWKGEADHPGWRKVKESLAALCGATAAAPPAYPMPAAPPPTAQMSAAPRKGRRLPAAAIAVSLLVIAALGALAWMRGGAPPQAAQPPAGLETRGAATAVRPQAVPPQPQQPPARKQRTAESQSRPTAQPRRPVNMRAAPRYCLGRGRDTLRCRRLRAQYGY